jgi:hypothetical protein
VALSGEEIRSRLSAFAARWSVYEGTERAEAQAFLTARPDPASASSEGHE